MAFFDFMRKKRNPSAVVGLTSADLGLFHLTYERKAMPSPGIPAYAYETLGLAVFTPIGAGIATRTPLRFATPTTLYNKAVPLAGMPIVTGALVKGPLFNPDSGGFAMSPAGMINDPFPRELTQAAGVAI
jgi:hypothetical protein